MTDETEHVPDAPRFGRYETLALLGAGAMGRVYRARDPVVGRAVAIKVVQTDDSALRERFTRETRAIGAVTHPSILAVYDASTDGPRPYLVMELADGSLRDRLDAGPLAPTVVREIGAQIADALATAHAAGIVHRDVKPANLLHVGHRWKLADFGIAHLPGSELTVTGQFLGSPAYAAPESLRTGAFSPASDVYALAATLFEAITGTPPHGREHASVMRKLDVAAPRLPASAGPLTALLARALATEPGHRPSAAELARALVGVDAPLAPAPASAPALRYIAVGVASAAIVALVAAILVRTRAGASAVPAVVADAPPSDATLDPPPPLPPPADAKRAVAVGPAGCTTYASATNAATWTDCPDDVIRSIACKPWMSGLTCQCLEDGAERWFFDVDRMPDFRDAAMAGRLARTQCKMGFGNTR